VSLRSRATDDSVRFVSSALLTILASCSDSTSPNEQPECTGPVQVAVTPRSTTPTFSWTPACRLFFVNIEPTGSGADLWNAISDSANAIASPVQYGVVPPGARQLTTTVALQHGTSYGVFVFRWTGPGNQDGVLVGSQVFTP